MEEQIKLIKINKNGEGIIPPGETYITDAAFKRSKKLKSIVIPDGVTAIGIHAFSDCASLENITFNGTIAQWNAIEFGVSWSYNIPATYVQCSDGVVAL